MRTNRRPRGFATRWAAVPRAAVMVALVLTAHPVGCVRTPEPPGGARPNVVLITVDTQRADHLSIYSAAAPLTPNMDSIGRDGAVFEAGYTNVTWTTPSLASVMTGTYPYSHGVRGNHHRLDPSQPTLAQLLQSTGYATAAVVGSYPASSVYGLGRGFDQFDEAFTRSLLLGDELRKGPLPKAAANELELPRRNLLVAKGRSRRTDDEVAQAAIVMLRRLSGGTKPFFLWVHYFGPHSLQDTTKDFFQNLDRHVKTYAAKTENTDRAVGELLRAVDAAHVRQNTLVILHSDHGEALREHKDVGHGRFLYQEQLRIPLLMRWPARIREGTRVKHLATNIDIAPTVLDAVGFEGQMPPMDGKSLLPAIEDSRPVRESFYAETYMPAHSGFAERVETEDGRKVPVGVRRIALVRPPYKLIRTELHPLYTDPDAHVPANAADLLVGDELYDLSVDPGETRRLDLRLHADVFNALDSELGEHAKREAEMRHAAEVDVDEEHVDKLRSLGYVD